MARNSYALGHWTRHGKLNNKPLYGVTVKCVSCDERTRANGAASPTMKGWIVRQWPTDCTCYKCAKLVANKGNVLKEVKNGEEG